MANKTQVRLRFRKGQYGINWKKLRESTGKTVREFAEEIYMAYSSISKIENETVFPTIEQINMYQEYFKVSIDYLVGATSNSSVDLDDITRYTGLSQGAIEKLHSYVEMAKQKIVYNEETNGVLVDNYIRTDWRTDLYNDIICDKSFESVLETLFDLKRETQLLLNVIKDTGDVESLIEGSIRGLIIKAQLLELELQNKINKFTINFDLRNRKDYIDRMTEIVDALENKTGFAADITDEEKDVALSHIRGNSPRHEINALAKLNTMSMLTLVDVSDEKNLY